MLDGFLHPRRVDALLYISAPDARTRRASRADPRIIGQLPRDVEEQGSCVGHPL
jgi:hypothetical protein